MPSPSLDASLVRILIDDQDHRRPVGAGFLVTPDHILTCAHVVNDALGRDRDITECPDTELFLDFPLVKGRVQYKIVANRPFWHKGITACFNRELFSVQQLINFV